MKKLLANPSTWLVSCLFASFFFLAYPLYVIRPFRRQGPAELAAVLAVLQARPYVELALVIGAIIAAGWSWKRNRRMIGHSLLALAALLTVAFGLLSRVNVYELMFHPLQQATFAAASKSKLGAAEQVIAIRENNLTRAYSVRVMSYHHIVNDTLGGVPVVATY